MTIRTLETALLALILGAAGAVSAQDPDQDAKRASRKPAATPAQAQARAAKAKARAKAKAEAEAKRIDVNSATKAQLLTLPGLTEAQADKIIAGRPYLTKAHLVTNGVLPEGVFLALRDRVVARQPGARK